MRYPGIARSELTLVMTDSIMLTTMPDASSEITRRDAGVASEIGVPSGFVAERMICGWW